MGALDSQWDFPRDNVSLTRFGRSGRFGSLNLLVPPAAQKGFPKGHHHFERGATAALNLGDHTGWNGEKSTGRLARFRILTSCFHPGKQHYAKAVLLGVRLSGKSKHFLQNSMPFVSKLQTLYPFRTSLGWMIQSNLAEM